MVRKTLALLCGNAGVLALILAVGGMENAGGDPREAWSLLAGGASMLGGFILFAGGIVMWGYDRKVWRPR